MTDTEKLEQKIKILEEKINTHNQKIEGYADTFYRCYKRHKRKSK